jgi:predicted outer membrane protein
MRTLLVLPAVAFLAASAATIWIPVDDTGARLAPAADAAPGGGGADGGETQTKYGPLSAADRDFLVKVQLAGSWEGPAGRMSLRRSENPMIQEAGRHLIAGHTELDAKVRSVAGEFNVKLPDEPSDELKGRLAAMDKASTPEAFDQLFVDMLRNAHGGVYQLLANIRAGTRNSLIRQFAERCMTVVLDHMTVLEKTGMVNWTRIPLPKSPTPGAAPEDGMTQAQGGPLSAADRDFLIRVRLAGLWEGPTGQQAQERAGSQAVKEAGLHMIDGHGELDQTVLNIGNMMNVPLPTEPNADQKTWIAEMTSATTPDAYDKVSVKRLRAAHGKVFGLVSTIRAGTRNTMIRAFAERCMTVVLDHMTMLEKTNLVDFSSLPPPPDPVKVKPRISDRGVVIVVVSMVGIAAVMTIVARGTTRGPKRRKVSPSRPVRSTGS